MAVRGLTVPNDPYQSRTSRPWTRPDQEQGDAQVPAVVEHRREARRPMPRQRPDRQDHVQHQDRARPRRTDHQRHRGDRVVAGPDHRAHGHKGGKVADHPTGEDQVVDLLVLVPLDPGVGVTHRPSPGAWPLQPPARPMPPVRSPAAPARADARAPRAPARSARPGRGPAKAGDVPCVAPASRVTALPRAGPLHQHHRPEAREPRQD